MGKVLWRALAAHSSVLAWKTPRSEEPGRLQSIGSQTVRHDCNDLVLIHKGRTSRMRDGIY